METIGLQTKGKVGYEMKRVKFFFFGKKKKERKNVESDSVEIHLLAFTARYKQKEN